MKALLGDQPQFDWSDAKRLNQICSSFFLYLLPLLGFQIFATKKDTKNPFQVFDVFPCIPDIVSQMIAPGFTPEQNFTA